ncbi:unnamed protein product, partial [Heterotrigona itama]
FCVSITELNICKYNQEAINVYDKSDRNNSYLIPYNVTRECATLMNFVDIYDLICTQYIIDVFAQKIIYVFSKIETRKMFKNYFILVLLIKVIVFHSRMC